MDLPADLLPVHSCTHCEKYIPNPSADSQPDIHIRRRSWKVFDPELTIGKLKELGQHGCLFGESVFSDLTRYESPSDCSPVLYCFIPWAFDKTRYQAVMFGVPEPADDDEESKSAHDHDGRDGKDGKDKSHPGGIAVYRIVRHDLMTTSDNAASKLITRRPINLDPTSNSSFHLARGWFQTCLADHTKCPKPSLNFMPKRVISISQDQSGFSLRLLETEGLRDMYCALSYCWGGDQKTKATKETLPELKDDIAFGKLPATLQDAVITTHGLGLRYLFVDSLCILQDDEEDIHTQIAQMSEIYSEAAVTILASRAKGVDFPFLHKRQSSLPSSRLRDKRYKMSLRCSNGELGSVVVLSSYSSGKESSGPLVSRAWALQENLLSARTLDYEDDHTTWRCSTINNLTDGWLSTSQFLDRLGFTSVPEVLRPRSAIKATDMTEHRDERQELFRQWRWLVKHYARLELSFTSDKLPAISAIAGRMGSALGDKYLAGIWKSRLPQDLLWDVRQRHPRPKSFRAPSWSWAAVDGDPARISTDNGSFSLKVLECHTEPKSSAAPYGAVKGGHLVVRGRLRRVVLSGIKGRIWTPFGKPAPTKVKLANLSHVVESGWQGSEAWIPMSFDSVEQEFQDNADMDVALLEVCEHESGPCYGLVLRPIGPQRFSRLGIFGYLYGPEYLDQGSSPGSDTDGELEGVEEWEPSYENWLQGFRGCDLTTLTLV